ncbi:AAA family ATPase [Yersinia enterocolitica]|uniref:AAA family ATPase n=1 Tax=Yersinia TaxID=629 RepID=UPI0005DDDB39|nr:MULTISPECIES: AAA family ATPase [Yersinia]EKN6132894.1 ATP-binding protein [Yersinia enterocolitica]CNH75946.1 hemin importer ATP-binding subunit [Yersinia aldovae]CQH26749.1 hemin importer ATP-binding subunit [Yersinia enterocolitica]HDL8415694.1 ATP-binding protein [Yersinia enterocolitica]
MYKLLSVEINGFWQRLNAKCSFNDDVNIIIGRNGTGKTTFMNILSSILSVDLEGINSNEFESAEIKLQDGNKKRTIKVLKIDSTSSPFSIIEYVVSTKKYVVRLINSEDRRISASYRRRAVEESEELRMALAKLVSLSSLSVYRLRSGEDFEVRDKYGLKLINPVDFRLAQLLQNLTKYQLDLSQQAREIASDLQKDVLASILYSKDDVDEMTYALDFDREKEKNNLISAYGQLNAIDTNIRRKISFHVDNIDKTLSEIKTSNGTSKNIDFRSLEAYRKTQKIIKMSLRSKVLTEVVFSPIELFLNTLKDFITDKIFIFQAGELTIHNSHGRINSENLSSGEKQLLILFIETLLQREQQFIFLTDEPELSLHIAWQRKIIPAIKKLNPNAQVIAATHSPEVASKYKNSIFDMEKLIHG